MGSAPSPRVPNPIRVLVAGLFATAALLHPTRADSENVLLGSDPPPRRTVALDPSLPTGPIRGFEELPRDSLRQACSFTLPVCVFPNPSVPTPETLRTLDALEVAYTSVVVALRLPPPPQAPNGLGSRVNLSLGGSKAASGRSHASDATLSGQNSTTEWRTVVQTYAMPLGARAFDSASTLCQFGVLEGSALERAATLCVAEAVAIGLDPGMSPHLRRAYASRIWWIVGRPTGADLKSLSALGREPHRALFGGTRTASSEGAGWVFSYLDGLAPDGGFAEVSTALVSRAGNLATAHSPYWSNEPDIVDVLRASIQSTSTPWPSFLGKLAQARSQIGYPAFPGLEVGWELRAEVAQPRLDWRIKSSSLPRQLLTRPIEPTGSTFLRLDFDEPFSPGDILALRMDCEGPVAFAWSVVKLVGPELRPSAVPVAYQENSERTERTVNELQNTRILLLSGTNVGAISPTYPFDPDIGPYEPHACTIYLTRL